VRRGKPAQQAAAAGCLLLQVLNLLSGVLDRQVWINTVWVIKYSASAAIRSASESTLQLPLVSRSGSGGDLVRQIGQHLAFSWVIRQFHYTLRMATYNFPYSATALMTESDSSIENLDWTRTRTALRLKFRSTSASRILQ